MGNHLVDRRGVWYFVRRVPKAIAGLDRRTFARTSTAISVADDPRGIQAARVAERLNLELEAYWRGLAEGRSAEARRRYDEARRRARAMGFDYVQAAEIAAGLSLADILARVERLTDRNAVDSPVEVAGALGGEAPPAIRLSGLFDEFRALQRASIADMSPNQIRKWANPRRRAVANLINVLGEDKPIDKVTRADAIDFRSWWQDRVLEEGLQIDSANKDIGHLNNMFTTVDQAHQLGLQPVFAALRIRGGGNGTRLPYDPEFVQAKILADGALDDLNGEARAIIYLMADAGLRITEACNLGPSTIVLDHKIPHVRVRPDGRRMKTPQSHRDIPLVGAALAAMRAYPDGFPRYRDRADSLSALLNKVLLHKGLRPTMEHTAYSLRHTFEDRLTAVEAPEKLIASLMGHKYSRPKYGAGPSLQQKREWLLKIAFRPPAKV